MQNNLIRRKISYRTDNTLRCVRYDLDSSVIESTQNPIDEYIRIIKEISPTVPSVPILLPMSGGIDSEVLARAFLLANVSFTPVIMKFEGGYNQFDIDWALEFCRNSKLIPEVISLNLDRFYETQQHLKYAELYQCRSPQLATHLWLMGQIDGFWIFPYNPLPLRYTIDRKMYIGFPPLLHLCYENFMQKNGICGIDLFNIYDSRIIYSFLKMPLYLESLFNQEFYRLFTSDKYLLKTELYRQGGFQVQARKSKATGFEIYRHYLNEKYNSKDSDYFDKFYRVPMENIVKDPSFPAIGDIDLKKLYDLYSA